MSDDFDFDANDLFDDFDDDDGFGDFDDDLGSDNVIEDSGFDDGLEDDDFDNFDDDEFGARLDFLDDDDGFGDDDVVIVEESGGNRNFLYAAIAMVVVFVLGLLLILFLVLGGFTNSGEAQATQLAFEASSTAVFIENETRQAQLAASATAAVQNVTATRQAALNATETSDAQANATNEAGIAGSATAIVVNATETQSAIEEATVNAIGTATQSVIDEEQAFIDSATQTAIAIEQTLNPPAPNVTVDPSLLVTVDANNPTPIPVTVDPNDPTPIPVTVDPNAPTLIVVTVDTTGPMPTTGPAVSLPAVQQTATALAQLFLTPTPNQIVPTTDSVVVVVPTNLPNDTGTGGQTGQEALPNTGLFDDVFGGNPMFIVLMALGLLGVIILSRTVRSTNGKEL